MTRQSNTLASGTHAIQNAQNMYIWHLRKQCDWQTCNILFVNVHFQNKQLILHEVLIANIVIGHR